MKKKWLWIGAACAAAIVIVVAVAVGLQISAARSGMQRSRAPVTVAGTTKHASPGYDELMAAPEAASAPAGEATEAGLPGTPDGMPADAKLAGKTKELLQLVAKLAPDCGLKYDAQADRLTGKGFPEGGIAMTELMSRLAVKLQAPEGKQLDAAAEVKTFLEQLTKSAQTPASPSGSTGGLAMSPGAGGGASELVPDQQALQDLANAGKEEVLIHAPKVYGDWISVREEHEHHTVEHSTDYYEYIQFHYNGTATFVLYRKGKAINRTRFTYRYDPLQGIITLLDAEGKPAEKYEAWAPKLGPEYGDIVLKLWLQRPGIAMRTVYEKVDNAGEPTTEEDILRGLRLYGGEEAVQQYQQRKQQYKTQ